MEIIKQVSEIKQQLISIIVPAYNIELYLSRCLDSILCQTYSDIEIIVVDDGSNDGTGEIADNYHKKTPDKVKVIHTPNSGVLQARLTGIRNASGEWIGFVDGDDVIEPEMYERLLNNAIKYDAKISHCGYQTIVNDGERTHYFYNTGKLVIQNHNEGLKDLLEGIYIEPGLCNKLFNVSLFEKIFMNEGKLNGLKVNEDLLMNYYLFNESDKSVFEDFCPYHYIARISSTTRTEFAPYKALDPVRVRKTIMDDIDSELFDLALSKYLRVCMDALSVLKNTSEYENECLEFRKLLIENKDVSDSWRRNDKVKLFILLRFPTVYDFFIAIYVKFFQKKIYE